MKSIPILAIDGGGTCCRGALCDEKGQLMAYAEDGLANYRNIWNKQTRRTLTQLLLDLLGQMGESSLGIKRAACGDGGNRYRFGLLSG